MNNGLNEKHERLFNCKTCDFVCRYKSDFKRHEMTMKHKMITNGNKDDEKNEKVFPCLLCDKVYKYRPGLSVHKKKCTGQIALDKKDKLIEMLVEKNTELQSDMLDLLKKGTTTQNNNNTMNHSHNKTFNLNFFLNDTCKDAMNITDFVESIKIQLGDLDTIGESGFVSGITDIIVKELRTIDVSKRPVHCSDVKRETMYVRDADKWEKEDDNNQKLNQMIDTLSHNNLKKLSDWKEAHPHSKDSTSVQSDQYNRIILGALDTSKENNNKIIKNLAKEVKI